MKGLSRLGTATIDITPRQPVRLSGFANRPGLSEGIHSRLHAKAFALESAEGGALVVCADLLAWDRLMVVEARKYLRSALGRRAPALFLAASHTHSAPGALRAVLPSLGPLDAAYEEFLLRQLRQVMREAWDSRQDAVWRMGTAHAGLGIHRRKRVGDEVIMAPSPEGPIDPVVTVVEFSRPGGESLGAWLHYTCHPTTKNDPLISSEYCGHAASRLEARDLGGAPCGFLQGCAGDIRPRLVNAGGDRFRVGTCADLEALGGRLYESAAVALRQARTAPGRPLRVRSARQAVRLFFEALPSEAWLAEASRDAALDPWRREWAAHLLDRPRQRRPHATLPLTGLGIGGDLALIGLAAEPAVAFGHSIRTRSGGRALPVGYANGLIGYVTTAAQLAEGGYESRRAYHFFGCPAAFDASSEQRIQAGVATLLRRLGLA